MTWMAENTHTHTITGRILANWKPLDVTCGSRGLVVRVIWGAKFESHLGSLWCVKQEEIPLHVGANGLMG